MTVCENRRKSRRGRSRSSRVVGVGGRGGGGGGWAEVMLIGWRGGRRGG